MKKIALLAFLLFELKVAHSQNLKKADDLRPNLTEEEVTKIMGKPKKVDFYKNVVEYHYCRTGFESDQFVALFFIDGKLAEKRSYTVTIQDTKGVGGKCNRFIKMGNFREPDTITELRHKN